MHAYALYWRDVTMKNGIDCGNFMVSLRRTIPASGATG